MFLRIWGTHTHTHTPGFYLFIYFWFRKHVLANGAPPIDSKIKTALSGKPILRDRNSKKVAVLRQILPSDVPKERK